MIVHSLGFKTEMIFHRFDSVIADRGDYIMVATPANPGFFYGNFLLFQEAPRQGSLAIWKEIFRKEFQDSPQVKHLTFLWDAPGAGTGDISELENEGFHIEHSVVLTAESVHPPLKMNSEVVIRPLSADSDWRQATENQILSKSASFKEAEYRDFKERQMARNRTMAESGLGYWFGAFLNGRLVGDLGIYRDAEIGRFQSVETHPDFQRRGICGALVYKTARFAFTEMGLKKLVMVADENYHAAKIYESVGFAPTANEYSAFWWKMSQ